MKINLKIKTSGTGLWSEVIKEVELTKLELTYVNKESDFGSLEVYFNTKTWNVRKDGLIYTDKEFLKSLIKELNSLGFVADNIEYSEQGAQGINYIDFDVDKNFIESFLNKEVNRVYLECCHNRLNPNKDYLNSGYDGEDIDIRFKGTLRDKVIELIKSGKKVKGGWYSTSVRGFHKFGILWKNLK